MSGVVGERQGGGRRTAVKESGTPDPEQSVSRQLARVGNRQEPVAEYPAVHEENRLTVSPVSELDVLACYAKPADRLVRASHRALPSDKGQLLPMPGP